MSASMRAKVRVSNVTPYRYPADGPVTQEDLEFTPVGKSSYPADGLDEDNTYAKYTPGGMFKLMVQNPALIGRFEIGEIYYVDFTPTK